MVFASKAVFLAAPLLSLLFPTIVRTSPLEHPGEADDALLILKRQAVDPMSHQKMRLTQRLLRMAPAHYELV